MQSVSTIFNRASKDIERELEINLKINGVDASDVLVIAFELFETIGGKDDIELGNFTSSNIKLKLRNISSELLVNIEDELELFVRFKNINKLSGEDDWSEFITLGKYYVDSIPTLQNEVLTVVAFDKTIFSDVLFETTSTFPITMQAMFNEVNAVVGYALGSSITIDPTYNVDYYNNTEPMTCREIIGHIAGCNSANAIISKTGLLEFRKLTPVAPVDTMSIGLIYEYEQTNPIKTITNIMATNDTETFQSGSDLPVQTLYMDNPFVNQNIADDIISEITGFTYLPIKVKNIGLPQLDLNDTVIVEKFSGLKWINSTDFWENSEHRWDGVESVTTVILENTLVITGGMYSTIENRGKSLQENEYILDGVITRRSNSLNANAVKTNVIYNGVRINKDDGIKIVRSDELAEVQLSAVDGINIKSRPNTGVGFEEVFTLDSSGDINMKGSITLTGGSGIANLTDSGDLATMDTVGSTHIDNNSITTPKLVANAITSDKIDVSQLSAISANIGTITAGTLRGISAHLGSINKVNISGTGIDAYISFLNSLNDELATLEAVESSNRFAITGGYDKHILMQTLGDGEITIKSNDNINIESYGRIYTNQRPKLLSTSAYFPVTTDIKADNGLDVSVSGATVTFDVDPSEIAGDGLREDGSQNFEVDDTVARTDGQAIQFQYFSDHLEVRLGTGSWKVLNYN